MALKYFTHFNKLLHRLQLRVNTTLVELILLLWQKQNCYCFNIICCTSTPSRVLRAMKQVLLYYSVQFLVKGGFSSISTALIKMITWPLNKAKTNKEPK